MKIGIRGVTVSDVRGFGAQGGSTERHGKLTGSLIYFFYCQNVFMEQGEIGDGKIFGNNHYSSHIQIIMVHTSKC